IMLRFKDKEKICQAGILTTAPQDPEHKLRIKIANSTLPGTSDTIEFGLADLNTYAPLDIYVTPTYGVPPITDSASKDKDYETIVNFEELLGRTLALKSGVLAPLRIHQGAFYVLDSDQTDHASIEKVGDPSSSHPFGKKVAKVVSIDINLDRGETKGQIVLV